MKNLIQLILILMCVTVLFISCGKDSPKDNNSLSETEDIEIRYSVSEKGITTIVLPFRTDTNNVNQIKVVNIKHVVGFTGNVYSIVKTNEDMKLDLKTCPKIQYYEYTSKCVYVIRI